MGRPTVFISYSHKDEVWKDRLVTHLNVLQYVLEPWDDRRIDAGADWRVEIEEAMDRAAVALLLISADFLTSKFILEQEVPRLLERRENRRLSVFPVIVRPCAWTRIDWLARIQARPRDGRPVSKGSEHQVDEDFAAIADEVAGVIERTAARGGVRAIGSDKVSLAKLPSTNPDLFGRDAELALLDAAWNSPTTRILSLVAWGGVGKTALVNAWLNRMQKDGYRGAERVLGWSFYSQGAAEGKQASADQFIAHALAWFGDPDPTKGSPWDKGERLAELVRSQRTLLVLDGLEPLQQPPGGTLKDPGLQALLCELAAQNPGLCVLTTRLRVEDLQRFHGGSVDEKELLNLSPEAGAKYLARLGVRGTPSELERATIEYDGHALALTLLGRCLLTVCSGDIRQRFRIPPLEHEHGQGAHARRVLDSCERWFEGKPELDILRIMSLFDRPAEGGAIRVVKAPPVIKGLTEKLQGLSGEDWHYAVSNLREVRLLEPLDPDQPETLDCHPLIREHFGTQLNATNPAAWRAAHSRLYEYFKSQAKPFPDTIEEMAPLYAAVIHGCHAGRHQEALDEVYRRRIQRGREFFSTRKLGAIGAELAALAGFFDPLWEKPVAGLSHAAEAYVLNEVGFDLQALGRLAEATPPLKASLDRCVALHDWLNAAIRAGNLSELYLAVGELTQAIDYARQSVEFTDSGGHVGCQVIMRSTLAAALHQAGKLIEAESLFQKAEQSQKEREPQDPLLYSLRGFRYCDLLLGQGKYREVQDRASQALTRAKKERLLRDVGLHHLSLGRAHLLQAVQEPRGDYSHAATHLDEAVKGLRQAGTQDHLPRGLLARAELHRIRRDFDHARRDLDEAMTIATRGGMRLHQADCRLECARLHLAMGDKAKALESFTTARAMITEMGYHRRDPEVAALETQLASTP